MKFSTSLFLLANLFLFTHSSAQNTNDNIDPVAGIFKMVIHNTQKEKIILQTDRKLYIAGETIWFKSSVINSVTNKIDLFSKNLFTDLVDDHDSVIAKLVLDNQQLNTNGAFILPDSIKTGFYWLRCYTANLLAQDPEGIFVQPVFVLNKGLHDEGNYIRQFTNVINKNKNAPPVIHFFPERLTDIPNIISTVVLQITSANNDPLIANGDLINSSDSLITSFSTNHFGMARVTFLHDDSQKYKVVFHVNGQDIQYALPAPDHSAAQLSVANQTAKSIKAFVTLEDSLSSNYRTIILGINGDSLCYAAVGTGIYGTTIALNNFPGGITSLLLFDEQQHLLAERKIFINKDNYKLGIKANKKNYAERDNATLNIKVTDADGEPLEAALDISVQDAWLAQVSDSIELNSPPPSNELLLNNWLTLYHDNYSPNDIDLLMMTSKSLYDDARINEVQHDDVDEKLINFSGKITDKKSNPIKDRVVTVISKNQQDFFADVDTTKEDGTFKIRLPQNMDSLSLSLQVTDKHGVIRTDDHITVDTFNFPQFATPALLKQQFLGYNINTLASLRKFHVDTAITFQGKGWLTPITVKTTAKTEPNYDVSKRINSISQILTSDKFRYGGYGAVTNAVLMVPGVTLANGNISIWGAVTTDANSLPLLVVDGVVTGYASLGAFNDMQPADIDFIEVLRGGEAGIYGMRAGHGVISVNTRNGAHVMSNETNNFRIFSPVTYHVSPPFLMPDYSNQEIKDSKMPDPRTTIYWNGNFTTDQKGQASINFYTADHATNYTVTVTGVSANGDLIYKRIFIGRN